MAQMESRKNRSVIMTTGNPKLHSFGKHGEHVHDYIYASDGKLKGRPMRELTDEERKENEDIL